MEIIFALITAIFSVGMALIFLSDFRRNSMAVSCKVN